LQLKWRHQFQFAGYYAALEKGYYREAGLDVTIMPASPSTDPVDVVLKGGADFGIASSELVLRYAKGDPGRRAGDDLPAFAAHVVRAQRHGHPVRA
jgi:ABC-type nitrate/sulfonate/bicarbonate transport system substrate-binding protein